MQAVVREPATNFSADEDQVVRLRVEQLEVDPANERIGMRRSLDTLADSIKRYGVLEPLRVYRSAKRSGGYTIWSGHRRYAAAIELGIEELPCRIVAPPTNGIQRDLQRLVTNLQRKDLTPVEQARGFAAVLKSHPSLTQAELAESLGLNQSYVSHSIRLLQLPAEVLMLLQEGRLSAGHGRALLGLSGNGEKRGNALVKLARCAAIDEWTVRHLEREVRVFNERATQVSEKASRVATEKCPYCDGTGRRVEE